MCAYVQQTTHLNIIKAACGGVDGSANHHIVHLILCKSVTHGHKHILQRLNVDFPTVLVVKAVKCVADHLFRICSGQFLAKECQKLNNI